MFHENCEVNDIFKVRKLLTFDICHLKVFFGVAVQSKITMAHEISPTHARKRFQKKKLKQTKKQKKEKGYFFETEREECTS